MSRSGPESPEKRTVDARGLLCPLPVIRLGELARESPPGALLELLADDPQAEEDVRLWCRAGSHELVSVAREGSFIRIRVRLAS